jgi:Tol biopolymer transport system component
VAAAAVILLGGGAAGCRFWSAPNAPNRTAATTTRAEPRPATRLTFAPGLQTDVTFSPDGRFIAYASDQGGNFDIWVQPVEAAGTPVRVTQSPAADTEPDWSPDGKQIVFRSERDGGGLFLVPALGGPERRISAFGARPKWSPDGSRIAFASDPQQFAAGLTFYLVGTDGRAPVPVPQARVEDGRQLVGGCWHPDGRLTFLTDTAAGRVLHTRTVENPAAVITTLPPALRNVGVANFTSECTWTPSADALLFEISTNNISHLWRLDVDTKSLAARALTQVSFGAGQDRRHALSRDGAKIAFSTVSDDIRLWLYSLDRQSGLIRGEPEPLTDPSAALPVTGELSPDGRRLVFPVTGIGTGQWELRVKDLQSGSSVRLFSDGHGRFLPHWSSDGTSLVYQRVGGGSARQELAIQRRPGGDEEVLAGPESGFITSHGWSPDGRAILVSWARGGPNPVLAFWPVAAAPHADRAAETIVADAAYGLWQGRISPNGRWLSFGAAASGKALVCIVPSDAHAFAFKRWNCVSDPRVWTDKPRWSSDGRFLYVWRRSGSMFNVWAVPFDDRQGSVRGTPFQVTHFDGPAHRVWADELSLAEPSVAADRMLLPVVHATGSVWLIENGAK